MAATRARYFTRRRGVAWVVDAFVVVGVLQPRPGQSLGKLLVGLRVTRTDGRPPGRRRLLARAVLDIATVGAFVVATNAFVPDDAGARAAPFIFTCLVSPCLLIAWVIRDGLLDVQLSR